jgi:hypothetical protein
MRTKTVADQHSRPTVHFRSCQWIEHLLNPLKINPIVHIPISTACEALVWRCMGRPATDLRDAKPYDQWRKGLAVYADTLFGNDHRIIYTSISIIPKFISAN